jgi:pilus assembly protein Flp/PilA
MLVARVVRRSRLAPVTRIRMVAVVTCSENPIRSFEMTRFTNAVRRFANDESGATMVEYAIMVALIAAICIAVVKVIGTKSNTAFQNVNAAM